MRRLRSDKSRKLEQPASPSAWSDADIAARSLHDPEAFSLIFDRYWETIFRFCYFRLGDWHEAEDTASQVFLNAFSSLSRFQSCEPDQTFRAWLFAIARNVLGNSWRYANRHPATPIDNVIHLPDRTASIEDQVLAREQHERLFALIDLLSTEQRELLELRLAGLSAAEIGHVMGRSQEAIRKAQSRTLTAMRAAVSDHTEDTQEIHHA